MTLSNITQRGLFWSLCERFGTQFSQFLVQLLLARLLLPDDFGLIAIVGVFLMIAQVFVDSGFSAALIQKKEVSQVDFSSVFHFNMAMSFIAAAVLSASAPLIARMYDEPQLAKVMPALSLSLILSAFAQTQKSMLTRELDFRTQMTATLPATIFSGVLGVALALWGWGVWALVVQRLTQTAAGSALLWIRTSWRPRRECDWIALHSMMSFGSRMLASGIVREIFQNLYVFVIGACYTAADLGYYTRARSFQKVPSDTYGNIAFRVMFPVFASIQTDDVRLRAGISKALRLTVFVSFPLMAMLCATAQPLVITLLTDKWSPAIPYVRLLSLVGMLYPINVLNLQILTAKGRSDLYFNLEVMRNLLTLGNIALTYRFGIEAMILGQIVCSSISLGINTFYTGRLLRYSLRHQISDVLPYLLASTVAWGLAYLISFGSLPGYAFALAAQVTTGASAYVAICWLFRLSALSETAGMLGSQLGFSETKASPSVARSP